MSYLKNLLCQNLNNLNIDIKGKNIGIALSGGADSTALFFCLLKLKKEIEFNLSVFHLNHLIREESFEEEQFIIRLLNNENVNYLILMENCKKLKEKTNKSLEMVAREVRYRGIEEFIKIFNIDYFFTAHHLDDQCETFILRLVKGVGLSGATGIKKLRGKIVRPFYNVEKSIIYNFLRENNIKFFEDKTNYETDYERNYIRHKILPLFETRFPKYRKHINEFINSLSEIKFYIEKNIKNKINIDKNNFFKLQDFFLLEDIEKKYLIEYILKNKCEQENILKITIDSIIERIKRLNYKKNKGKAILYRSKYSILFYSSNKVYFYKRSFFENILKKIPKSGIKINIGEITYFYYILNCWEIKNDKKNIEKLDNIESLKNAFFIDKSKLSGRLEITLWKDGYFINYDINKKKKVKKLLSELKIPWFLRKFVLVLKDDGLDEKEVIGIYFNKIFYLSKRYYINSDTNIYIKIEIKEGLNFYG